MVVYTVTYSFQNIGSGYNATNFSTGTTYINSINSNSITTNSLNVRNGITNVNPTSLTNMQVGYRTLFTGAQMTCTNAGSSYLAPAPTLPAGTWLISSSHQFSVTSTASVTITKLAYIIQSGSTASFGVNDNPSYVNNTTSNTITQFNYLTYNNSYVLSLTGTSNNIYTPISHFFTGGTLVLNIIITATRLA